MELRNCLKDLQPYIPGKAVPGAIKLASNENPLGASPHALKIIKKNIETISIYPDYENFDLREKLAKHYKLDKHQFILGNGSDEVLRFIAAAYVNPGDEVLISEVTFSEYVFSTTLFDARQIMIPTKNLAYDLEAFLKAITAKTKIIYLCSPNNPTGLIIEKNKLYQFLKQVPKHVLVVIDEAYYEYAMESKDYHDSVPWIEEFKNIIVLRTFSKIYGLAGLRIGYGIATRKIIDDLQKTREPFNVNLIAQMAAYAAIEDYAFVKKSKVSNTKGKKEFYKALDKMKLEYLKTEGNFVYIETGRDAKELFKQIVEMGVTIRPLTSFKKPTAIRITIGTPAQNKKILSILKKVLHAGS